MSINRKTGKNKGIAFVLSPHHIHNELPKLNGIEFHGKFLILEEAMFPGKVVKIKIHLKNQMLCQEIHRAKMRKLTAIKTIKGIFNRRQSFKSN